MYSGSPLTGFPGLVNPSHIWVRTLFLCLPLGRTCRATALSSDIVRCYLPDCIFSNVNTFDWTFQLTASPGCEVRIIFRVFPTRQSTQRPFALLLFLIPIALGTSLSSACANGFKCVDVLQLMHDETLRVLHTIGSTESIAVALDMRYRRLLSGQLDSVYQETSNLTGPSKHYLSWQCSFADSFPNPSYRIHLFIGKISVHTALTVLCSRSSV